MSSVKRDYRVESRRPWLAVIDESANVTVDDLKLGCMLRMADGIEAMSKNYLNLQVSYDALTKGKARWVERCIKLERSVNALKGMNTKLKKKLEAGSFIPTCRKCGTEPCEYCGSKGGYSVQCRDCGRNL